MRALASMLLLLATAVLAGVFAISRAPDPAAPLPPRDGPALAAAKTWGYQLQYVDHLQVPEAIDMMVVDYSRDGTAARAFTPADVEALRTRPGRSPRIVLCYLSIGEAENYRAYWDMSWNSKPPQWLGAENAAWKGNFAVRFWQPGWQRLIVESRRASLTLATRIARALFPPRKPYLDEIIDAGFDGVYLDRVDAYEKAQDARPTAKSDMIAFVGAISAHARARRPGFLVVPQNGEELLAGARYRAMIDGVAKEDLFYGEGGDSTANPPDTTRAAIGLLNRAKADGLPVFVIEYIPDPERQRTTLGNIRNLGFTGLFAERGLKQPPVLPPSAASGQTSPVQR